MGLPVIMPTPAPTTVGKMSLKKPASFKPVLGLILRDPPLARAKSSRPFTSPLVM